MASIPEGRREPTESPQAESPHLPFILAFVGDPQGCGWHRIRCPAAGLMRAGLAHARVSEVLIPVEALKKNPPDSIIWQHQTENAHLEYLGKIREALPGCKIVFEIDDHLGAIDESNWHEAFVSSAEDIEERMAAALRHCDSAAAATDGIAAWVDGLSGGRKMTITMPNFLLEIDSPIQPPIKKRAPGTPVRIGWSGGVSHKGDLEILGNLPALVEAELSARGWGGPAPVFVFQGMRPPGIAQDTYEFHEGVPVLSYSTSLISLDLDLVIAPLLDTEFNRCKSALRLEQAGWLGAAIISSRVGEYKKEGTIDSGGPIWRYAGDGGGSDSALWASAVADWIMLSEAGKRKTKESAKKWAAGWGMSKNIGVVAKAWGVSRNAQKLPSKTPRGARWVVSGIDPAFLVRDHTEFEVVDDRPAAYERARATESGLIVAREGSRLSHGSWSRILAEMTPTRTGIAPISASTWSNDGAFGATLFDPGNQLNIQPETSDSIAESLAAASKDLNPDPIQLAFPVAPVTVISPTAVQSVVAWPRGGFVESLAVWGVVAAAAGGNAQHILVPGAWALSTGQEAGWDAESVAVRGIPAGLLQTALGSDAAKAWKRQAEITHAARVHKVPIWPGDMLQVLPTWLAYYYGGDSDREMQSVARIPLDEWAEENLNAARKAGIKWIRWDFPGSEISNGALATLEDRADSAGVSIVYGDWIAAIAVTPPGQTSPQMSMTPIMLPKAADWVYGLARDWVSATALIRLDIWDSLEIPVPKTRQDVWAGLMRGIKRGISTYHYPRPMTLAIDDYEGFPVRKYIAETLWPDWDLEMLGNTGIARASRRCPGEALRKASIIIPTTGDPWILRPCLASMAKHTKWEGEVERILVLSGSREKIVEAESRIGKIKEAGDLLADDSRKAWEECRVVRVESESGFNFSAACNAGAKDASGDLLVFCNDDIRFPQDHWLSHLAGVATLPKAGWVQPRLIGQSGACQCAGVFAGDGCAAELFRDLPINEVGIGGYAHSTHAVGACSAAIAAIETSKFNDIGRFPAELPLDFNDVVAGIEARRRDLTNYLAASVDVIHGHSMTRMTGVDEGSRKTQLGGALAALRTGWPDPDPTFPECLRILPLDGGISVAGSRLDLLRWWEPADSSLSIFVIGRDIHAIEKEVKAGFRVYVGAIIQEHLHTVNPRIINQPPIHVSNEESILNLLDGLRISRVIGCPIEGEETILPDVIERWNGRLRESRK